MALQLWPTHRRNMKKVTWQQALHDYCDAATFIQQLREPILMQCRCYTGAPDWKRYVFDWRCSKCHKVLSRWSGTLLTHTKIDARSWLMAVYVYTKSRGEIQATELQQAVGMSRYATAHRMLNFLRAHAYIHPEMPIEHQMHATWMHLLKGIPHPPKD